MTRRARKERLKRKDAKVEQSAFRQLKNPYKPFEILSDDQLGIIHESSMEILENVGIDVQDRNARTILKDAGFDVAEGSDRVRMDRDGVMVLVDKAPSSFTVHGRNPMRSVKGGDGYVMFSAVAGPPFGADLDSGRRAGVFEDTVKFLKLTQSLNILHLQGGASIEPTDLPPETRHLDLSLACARYLDKPWKPNFIGRERSLDAIEFAKILHGTDEAGLAKNPVYYCNTNTNTPLILDREIAQGVIELAGAGQVICITPFTLAGAMTPASLAGALAMQNAEALAGCAFVQAIRPGCPFVYGSFTMAVDMKSGSPTFGTPEFAKGAAATGQLARLYGLPWRSSNACTSCAPDAQAAYETQMSLWSAITAHVSVIYQGAGWLEGGLVGSFEKLILDAEMLQMFAAWMEPFEVSPEEIGLATIAEIGPGGHFLGTAHTMERYENAFYRPLVSDWNNFENWRDAGARDAAQRANGMWKRLLDEYEQPALDPAVDEELKAFVAKRKEACGVAAA
ncbi:MAG: trimethylamine methyltransferase family protein [Hyphomicrobiales bacterium]|nr:trimethylamine methyltransferase family protein [Hyphomicrobiales bacterium]MCP5001830.1 trimethylamine methyltransferase family protein [Hyphomicrobiales bacterium]